MIIGIHKKGYNITTDQMYPQLGTMKREYESPEQHNSRSRYYRNKRLHYDVSLIEYAIRN